MPRAFYGILAFLPITGVVFVVIWLVTITFGRPAPTLQVGPVGYDLPNLTLDELVVVGIAVIAIALVQIATAIVLVLHVARNRSLTEGTTIAWMLALLFVGSIAQPIYFFEHVRRPFRRQKSPWRAGVRIVHSGRDVGPRT